MNVLNKLISGNDQNATAPGQPSRNSSKTNVPSSTSSSLYQIPMPEGLEAKNYGELVKHLAKQGILAIGLLRGLLYNMNVGPKANKMVYVYTNPCNETEVFSCDRVFVLSPKVLAIDSLSKKQISKVNIFCQIIHCCLLTFCSVSIRICHGE
jgi:hypothetical protein